jgi:hypothetical protein
VDAYDRWAVAAITQGVMDSSVVLVYMKDPIDDVYLLPYTNPYDNSYVYDHLIVGYIIFISSSAIFFSNDSFRYVIVPAAMVATGIPQSYKEMTAKLGIAP